jgi:hypothetical protein
LKHLEDARAVGTEHSIMTDATSLAKNLQRVISRIIGCQRRAALSFDFAQLDFSTIQS